MKSKALILSTGLAMFSMFFGSGNLVFPLMVGQASQGHFGIATFGILLTGVLVPFLGILAMLLFKGNSNDFFIRFGKPATFWFPLIALSLMGPFGVLARCITVAHGAFRLVAPEASLWLFSLCACAIIFLLTIRKNRIVPVLGSILTPFLLISLATIVVCAVLGAPLPSAPSFNGAWSSFSEGVFQGYQTMDLLAAFFFSIFVIKHLESHKALEEHPAKSFPIFLKSSLVGAALLSIVYFSLVLMGAIYTHELIAIPPQEMFGFIAQKTLGPWAAPMVCGAVILACLTTAIILTSLFADFLKKEIAHDKIHLSIAVITTLIIGFFTSTLEFSGIARFIGPILEVIYPALIVLTVLSIFQKLWGWKIVRLPTAVALLLKLFSIAI